MPSDRPKCDLSDLKSDSQTAGWQRAFNTADDPDTLSTIVSIYEVGCAVGARELIFSGLVMAD